MVLLLAISIKDFLAQRIPNELNLVLFLFGVLVLMWSGGDLGIFIGVIIQASLVIFLLVLIRHCYGFFRQQDGLGMGDVKFIAASVPWIGLIGIPSMLLIASGLALVTVTAASICLWRSLQPNQRVPFGPYLSSGLAYVWFAGPVDINVAVLP